MAEIEKRKFITMQIKENTKEYDVIIVGSGAGGGMATKILSEAGLSVALVEAGPYLIQKIQSLKLK